MITDSYSKTMSEIGMRSVFGGGGGGGGGNSGDIDIEEELGLVLREQQRRLQEANDRERELSIFRSGSAPPTVEGSLNAVGGLFTAGGGGGGGSNLSSISEEEIRSDPAYVSYYYSNVNLNPRLPPPLLSKEDWRLTQRLQGGGTGAVGGTSVSLGGIGDRRKVGRGNGANSSGLGGDGSSKRSLFSMQPAFGGVKDENGTEAREEWGGDGLIGLPGLGLGSRQKSIAAMIQDDINHASISRHPSRQASRVFDDVGESSESQYADLHLEMPSVDALGSGTSLKGISTPPNTGSSASHTYAGTSLKGISTPQNTGSSASHTYAAVVGASLSRSTTPDPQLGAKAPSPRIPFVGEGRTSSLQRRNANVQNSLDNVQLDMGEHADLVSAFSGMNLSGVNNMVNEGKHLRSQVHYEMDELFHGKGDHNTIKQHSYLNKSTNSYLKGPSALTPSSAGSSPSWYPNVLSPNSSFSNYGLGGCAINPSSPSSLAGQLGTSNLPPLFENVAAAAVMGASGVDSRATGGGLTLGPNLVAAAAELQNLRVGSQNLGSSLQMPPMDPLYLQYLRSSEYTAVQLAALNDPSINRETLGASHMDMLGLQKAYLGTLLSSQKSHYGLPFLGKSGALDHGYYGNPAFGAGMSYPGSPLGGTLLPNSPLGSGSPVRHGNIRYPSVVRNLAVGGIGSWHSETGGTLDETFMSSLLDEFKNNKTKSFELAEIAGHVVEFSADQFGSRFIQQKLETACTEEKNMVFHEILPQALSLMTDVFGNYVIQKFFEHGSAPQIRELADQLTGHVLTLSLQMYGCRVIQKAIEVVELDQQTKMVAELDGHVMRCVRDQNGNHVIQKCIECVPEDAIQFIVSTFYDQVITLSTHPYGCRVIQRVLEHCHDPKTQSIMMDEILKSVVMLAQDQYGNYVVQHVLQRGKPDERSSIISKLIGQIVQMSQQKFASNVVEKCLTFGTPEERKTIVNEMLGATDENEPLQVMMKDQFANYVVQKVLETCDDQQLELILNRIKVHLNALKKYTYGKHIVARVEKLVAAGERRIGILNSA